MKAILHKISKSHFLMSRLRQFLTLCASRCNSHLPCAMPCYSFVQPVSIKKYLNLKVKVKLICDFNDVPESCFYKTKIRSVLYLTIFSIMKNCIDLGLLSERCTVIYNTRNRDALLETAVNKESFSRSTAYMGIKIYK